MNALVISLSCLCVIFTLMPFIPSTKWYVRGFDFIHAQVSLITAGSLLLVVLFIPAGYMKLVLVLILAACFLYQAYLILPYTPLAKKQVQREKKPGRSIGMITCNVLMSNRDSSKLTDQINRYQPELVLLVETDQWWCDQVSHLKKAYPFSVIHPLDNTYGMLLLSKFRLSETEVLFLVEKEVPSIHTRLEIDSDQYIRLHCLHPAPPSPTENESAAERDAELLLVAKIIDTTGSPVIVMGDLNDVAWSGTTRLFQKISGLLDPRIGRGFYNTFHASYPLFRWPLDHVFHSSHFKLVKIKRLKNIGSDHFPIYVKLSYRQQPVPGHIEPSGDQTDENLAAEKIKQVYPKLILGLVCFLNVVAIV